MMLSLVYLIFTFFQFVDVLPMVMAITFKIRVPLGGPTIQG